jgi:hypothetical protein
MSLPVPNSRIAQNFFFSRGRSRALARWLSFRSFIKNKDRLSALISDIPSKNAPLSSLLQYFDDVTELRQVPNLRFLLLAAACLFGGLAMTGCLTLNGERPINIWLPLALFALLPFALTLVSLYLSVLSPTRFHWQGHPFIGWFVKKYKLTEFRRDQSLINQWVFWQLQTYAIAFMVSALITFFALATFQDFQFGWSSTLIKNDETMMSLVHWFALPWGSLSWAPSLELIQSTRFSDLPMHSEFIVVERWWPTLVSAVVVYGLIPRMMLSLFLSVRFKRALMNAIGNSGDIEQFVNAVHHQESIASIESSEGFHWPDKVPIDSEKFDMICWHDTHAISGSVHTLGVSSWASDEAWLKSTESQCSKPVIVIVHLSQTPTGELSDCFMLLKENNADVSLVVLNQANKNQREDSLMRSWQYFASQNQITLNEGVLI